jgi:hypothetical protein
VCAATDGSDVVGLAGVGQGEEVAEGYALGGSPLEIRCLVALITQILDMNETYIGVTTDGQQLRYRNLDSQTKSLRNGQTFCL